MKTVALVPIKMNNERLPGKNTKCFSDGTPLIHCILETLEKVPELDEIYVYCSNSAIREFFPGTKTKYLVRDKRLDLSTTKFNDVLTSFAQNVPADIYVLTHATAPFIRPERFSEGINAVRSGKHDCAFAVEQLREFLWKDGKPFNYDPANIPRTQDLELMLVETCGMYIYTSDLIKTQHRRIGNKPYFVEVTKKEACDINLPEDFEIADAIYSYVHGIEIRGGGYNLFKLICSQTFRKGGAAA